MTVKAAVFSFSSIGGEEGGGGGVTACVSVSAVSMCVSADHCHGGSGGGGVFLLLNGGERYEVSGRQW